MEVLIELRDQLSFFTSFRFPKDMRKLCKQAMSDIETGAALAGGISNAESPLVCFIHELRVTPKCMQYFEHYASALLKATYGLMFRGDALWEVTQLICSGVPTLSFDVCREIVRSLDILLFFEFPRLLHIRSAFSFAIAVMGHTDAVISGVGRASFQQMVDVVIEKIEVARSAEKEAFRQQTNDKRAEKFDNPLFFILYLVFDDMSRVAMGCSVRFIATGAGLETFIYEVFKSILDANEKVFTTCPQLANVFGSTLIESMNNRNALPFAIRFMDCCASSQNGLCAAIMAEYVSHIKSNDERLYMAMFWIHNVALKRKKLVFEFYVGGEHEVLMETLITNVGNVFCQYDSRPEKALEFPMKLVKLELAANSPSFVETAIYESIFGLTASFASSERCALERVVRHCGATVIHIVVHALRYCSISSFNVVAQTLLNCYRLAFLYADVDDLKLFVPMMYNFDRLSKTQKMDERERKKYCVAEKNRHWKDLMYEFVTQLPGLCSGEWPMIFATLFGANEAVELSPSFAKNCDKETVREITQALVTCQPFPYEFINDFIVTNIAKFDVVWSVIMEHADDVISRSGRDRNGLKQLLIGLLTKGFVEDTNEAILQLGAKMMSQEADLAESDKMKIIHGLRKAVANFSKPLNGWPSLLELLSPSNCGDSGEVVSAAFTLTNLVYGDWIRVVDDIFVDGCIDLAFQYAFQTTLLNVSLSSFDLLWVIVPRISNERRWRKVLDTLVELFFDTRVDVVQGATNGFFTIFTANAGRIPDSVTTYYVREGWPDVIRRAGVTPLVNFIGQGIVHLLASLWDKLDGAYMIKEFLPFLIETQERLIMASSNEAVSAAYELYLDLCRSGRLDDSIHTILCESLLRIAVNRFATVTGASSLVLAQFGRMLSTIVSGFKNKLDSFPYPKWIDMTREIALTFKGDEFVNIATERMLTGYAFLFPMPEDKTRMTLDMYMTIYNETSEHVVRVSITKILRDVWIAIDMKEHMFITCCPCYEHQLSLDLCTAMIKHDLAFATESVSQAIVCYEVIGKTHETLQQLTHDKINALSENAPFV